MKRENVLDAKQLDSFLFVHDSRFHIYSIDIGFDVLAAVVVVVVVIMRDQSMLLYLGRIGKSVLSTHIDSSTFSCSVKFLRFIVILK